MLRLKYLGIFNFLLILYLFFLHFNNKKIEKLTNTEHTHEIDISQINKVIQEKYEIDIESIRNLSSISKSLQEGGLTIPGNIRVQGHANIDGNFNYLPKGSIIAFNGTKAPNGWAICDGKNGTPNLKGRFIYGYSGTGRSKTLRETGGLETVNLTTKQMPEHNHTIDSGGNHSHRQRACKVNDLAYPSATHGKTAAASDDNWGCVDLDLRTLNDGSHIHSMGNTGSSESHENMPPYCVLLYIIKL